MREKMNGYFAVALTKNDSKLVSTKATFPIVVSDHITLAYKPSKRIYNKYKKLVGHKVGAMIEGYRSNNAIDALWVGKMIDINTDKYIKRHDDGDAHITLSHKKGYKQGDANSMFVDPTIKQKKLGYVEGVVKYFDYNKRGK